MENISKLYIDEIASCLINNHATIMVGAGFSKNAKEANSNVKKKFLDWNELSDRFYEKLYTDKSSDIRYASPLTLAQEVEDVYGRTVLDSILLSSIPDIEYNPSDLHKNLLSLPWKDIFSTNYDTLLERSRELVTNRRYNVVLCKDDLINSADNARIIKLHGTFPSNRPFIITEEDYRKYPNDFSPFVNTVQQSLLENTLCLIGFSGDDPNFLKWIGWIRDNLGKENSPKIYLISHKGEAQTKVKMLQNKNIEIVVLDYMFPGKEYAACLNDFFEYLLKKIDQNETSIKNWISIDKFEDFDSMSCTKVVDILSNARCQYPGWIVIPFKYRKKISYILSFINRKLLKLKNTPEKDEMFLAYEYCWLNKVFGRPIFQSEVHIIENILSRNIELKIDNVYIDVELSLFRAYREFGFNEKWRHLNIGISKKELNSEQKNEYNYELIMHNLYTFDNINIKEQLDLWDISNGDFNWSIKKIGLLAEVGDLNAAKELGKHTLFAIRNLFLQDKNNNRYKLLSYESCLTSLVNYINQAIKPFDDFTDEIHKDYTLDFIWLHENSKYEDLLTKEYAYLESSRITPSFDLGRNIIHTTMSSYDEEALTAFEFVRFREETGHPFRLKNIVSSKGIIGTIKRINRYNSFMSLILAIRANNKDAIEFIYNRSSLLNYSVSDVDELCDIYISILYNLLTVVKAENWFSPSNIYEYATQVLPEVLSRLCSKCSVKKYDTLIELLLKIYNSKNKANFKGVDHLLNRLINALTIDQQQKRLQILLKFPIQEEDFRFDREFPDPVTLMTNPIVKVTLENNDFLETLFNQLNTPELRRNAFNRIMSLYFIVVFPDKYLELLQLEITKNIDEYGIPNIENYYKLVILDLPHKLTDNEIIKESLVNYMLDNIKKNVSIKPISPNKHVYKEAIQFANCNILNINHLEQLANLAIQLWEMTKDHIEQISILGNPKLIVREDLSNMSEILGTILFNSKETEYNYNLKNVREYYNLKNVREYYSLLNRNNISCTLLGYSIGEIETLECWIKKLYSIDNKIVLESINAYLKIFDKNSNIFPEIIDYFINAILVRNSDNINLFINAIVFVMEKAELTSIQKNKILIALSELEIASNSFEDEDENTVVKKCLLRKDSASLAFSMYKKYYDSSDKLPDELNRWKEICSSDQEFVEIRNGWSDL